MPTECCAAKTVGPYSYTLVDSPEQCATAHHHQLSQDGGGDTIPIPHAKDVDGGVYILPNEWKNRISAITLEEGCKVKAVADNGAEVTFNSSTPWIGHEWNDRITKMICTCGTGSDHEESFPAECKKSCAYTRDGEDGTLYCFAPGNLPVHCKGEIPVDIFIATYGPFGNLPGQVDTFNDSSQTGHITGLNMWTGKFDGLDVVTGIQMIYGGLPGQAYGDTTGQKKECPSLPMESGDQLQYTKITIYSFEDKQSPISDQNQIYSMKFEVEVDGEVQTQFTCQTGDPSVGNESVIPEPLATGGKGGKHPGYIVGKVLTGGNGALQSLSFIFNFE